MPGEELGARRVEGQLDAEAVGRSPVLHDLGPASTTRS
jgi:hypothetical protein